MSSPFNSLRWRIQAWHALLLLLVIAGFMVPALHLARENMMRRIDSEIERLDHGLMRSMVKLLRERSGEEAIPPPPEATLRLLSDPSGLDGILDDSFHGTDAGYAYVGFRNTAGELLFQTSNAPPDLEFLPTPGDEAVVMEHRRVGNRREHAHSHPEGLRLVIGRDITHDLDRMRAMTGLYAGVGLTVWLLGLLGGWWLSGRAIRPIKTISGTASRIAEGNSEERIDPSAMDTELAELSRVLNNTFDRLGAAFERQRQFTADASHELRTPITILLSESQRLLKRERTPDEYREGLATCAETAQRMRRLADSLLILARQEDIDQLDPDSRCDLSEVVEGTTARLQPLARQRNRSVESHLSPAPCRGDADTLGLLVDNLVGNALDHGGNTTVTCETTADWVRLEVRDDGPGIPEDDLPHVFERFYRSDPARTASSGHSGLGLAIVKAIAENHGGTIHASNHPEGGAVFEVRLPAR